MPSVGGGWDWGLAVAFALREIAPPPPLFSLSLLTINGNVLPRGQLSALAEMQRLLDAELYDYLETIDALNFFFAFRWVRWRLKCDAGVFWAIVGSWEGLLVQ